MFRRRKLVAVDRRTIAVWVLTYSDGSFEVELIDDPDLELETLVNKSD